MIHGYLPLKKTYCGIEAHSVWRSAFEWLNAMPKDIAVGEYPLRGRDQFVSVQEYATVPPNEARFESHRAYVDLQYTISGAEAIDWIPRDVLVENGAFENDVQFWMPPKDGFSRIIQWPGRFSIFYPEDAHRPKLAVGNEPKVKKLVIKTLLSILG